VRYVPTHTVDLNNIDAVRKHIFNATYLYAIPGYYRYSKEYNKIVGHLDTGSKEMNQRVLAEYVDVGGTIQDILKLFEKGADIKMRVGSDLVTIYEVLVTHIGNWAAYINNDPNVKDAPLESLYLMADFCQSIQAQVKGFKPKVEDVPHLKRAASLFGMSDAVAALFSPGGVVMDSQDPESDINSIEKMLAQRKAARKK